MSPSSSRHNSSLRRTTSSIRTAGTRPLHHRLHPFSSEQLATVDIHKIF
jgi:hypothetical protein